MYLLEICIRYGFVGTLRLIRDLFLTILFFKKARIIRHPWYVRGNKYIDFGSKLTSGVGLRFDALGEKKNQITFGSNVQIGDYVHIAAVQSVIIGDDVLMASKVYISDHDHGIYQGIGDHISLPSQKQIEKIIQSSPVKIGNNVWIGENVSILKGVDIGENSIIGASSVVTKSIPANCIVVGNPARIIKRFDFNLSSWVKC